MAQDPTSLHEELSPFGFEAFTDTASRLVLGDSQPLIQNRICAIQTLGAENALRLGLDFLKETTNLEEIYLPNVAPKSLIDFIPEGITVQFLPYFDEKTNLFDEKSFISKLKNLPRKSCIVLETGGKWNLSGAYPTDWSTIIEIISKREIFPIFGSTQQGFIDVDLGPFDKIVEKDVEFMICHDFTHTLGLYSQPIGLLSLVTKVSFRLYSKARSGLSTVTS